MHSSYGSYSSMSSLTQPLDMTPSSYLSRSSSYHQASCAFPSWPQRPSLGGVHPQERASSYLSNDDLLDLEDDAHSISGASSNASTSPCVVPEQDVLEMRMQREREAQALRFLVQEKERRKAQAARKRRCMTASSSTSSSSSSSRKSPKSKSSAMNAISEVAVQ